MDHLSEVLGNRLNGAADKALAKHEQETKALKGWWNRVIIRWTTRHRRETTLKQQTVQMTPASGAKNVTTRQGLLGSTPMSFAKASGLSKLPMAHNRGGLTVDTQETASRRMSELRGQQDEKTPTMAARLKAYTPAADSPFTRKGPDHSVNTNAA